MTDYIENMFSKLPLDRSKGRILLGTLAVLGVAGGLLYGLRNTKPAPVVMPVVGLTAPDVAPEEVVTAPAPVAAPEEVAAAPVAAPVEVAAQSKAPKKAKATPQPASKSTHTCDSCKDTTIFPLKLKEGGVKMVPCNGVKGGTGCPFKASLPPTESVACSACRDTGKFKCWTKEGKVVELECKGPKGGDGCKAPGKTESVKPKCKMCKGTGEFTHQDGNKTACRCTKKTTPAGAPPVKKGKGQEAPPGEPPVKKGKGQGSSLAHPEPKMSALGLPERRKSVSSHTSTTSSPTQGGGAGGPDPDEGEDDPHTAALAHSCALSVLSCKRPNVGKFGVLIEEID